MLSDVIEFLLCPSCGEQLFLRDGSVHCRNSHSFDVARQGYVNLLTGTRRAPVGDTPAMVEARARFLRRGHYAPIVQSVVAEAARAVGDMSAGSVIDIGAGIGYYLAQVLGYLPDRVGLAVDASKAAMQRAARAHARIGAVVCDAWLKLPVRTGAAAVALNVFAPRNPEELHRILMPGGSLVVVTPSRKHLEPLVSALDLLRVDDNKERRLAEKVAPFFGPDRRKVLEFPMTLRHDEVEELVAMGPSAWHTDGDALRGRVAGLPEPVVVEACAVVSVYRRR